MKVLLGISGSSSINLGLKLLKNLDKHPNDSFKERGIYIGLCK